MRDLRTLVEMQRYARESDSQEVAQAAQGRPARVELADLAAGQQAGRVQQVDVEASGRSRPWSSSRSPDPPPDHAVAAADWR
jgi:hypothetical protein